MAPHLSSTSSPGLPTTLINKIASHTAPINAFCFSELGGTYVLSGSSDRQIHLTRTEPQDQKSIETRVSSTPIQRYQAHGYPILDIACASDNQSFVSAGGDRNVFLWDVQKAVTTRRFGGNTTAGHSSRVNAVRFAGESDNVVVTGGDDRRVLVWDCKSRDARPICEMMEAGDGVSSLWIPGGVQGASGIIVAGSVDGKVRWYDLRMGQIKLDVMPASVVSLEGTADGNVALVGTLDNSIRMIDGRDGKCLQSFTQEGIRGTYTNSALRLKSCFGANETLVLAGSESDGTVRAWDVLQGNVVDTVDISAEGKVVSVTKWREGNKIAGRNAVWAAGGTDGLIRVYGHGKEG